jgi:hypothetical protein
MVWSMISVETSKRMRALTTALRLQAQLLTQSTEGGSQVKP